VLAVDAVICEPVSPLLWGKSAGKSTCPHQLSGGRTRSRFISGQQRFQERPSPAHSVDLLALLKAPWILKRSCSTEAEAVLVSAGVLN